MKSSPSCLLALVLLALVPAVNAQVTQKPVTSEDEAIFKTLFREKLTTVNRTRSTADDLTLAQEMMALAKASPDDPGVQCLLYIETIPLAASGSDIPLMSEAIALLEELWPGHEAASVENQLDLSSRAYRAVPRSERGPVGEAYIKLLMGLVKQSKERGDLDEAINIGQLANTIARTIDSDQRERVVQELKRLSNESALIERIQRLSDSVNKNPQNSPAAIELVELLLKKRNDPAAALPYVDSTDDEELIDLVNHAAKGVDHASAAVAMRVGDWYRILAESEQDLEAEVLLSTARVWYARFFTLYTRQDALAKRVETMDQNTAFRLDVIHEKLGIRKETDWLDLIKDRFDPEQHAKSGEVRVKDNQLQCEPSSLLFPAATNASYEFEVSFKVVKHDETDMPMIFLLPAGDRFVRIRYRYTGALILSSDLEEVRHTDPERGNDLGKTRKLNFQIIFDEEEAQVAVLLDGEQVMEWEGAFADLPDRETLELPEGMVGVIRAFVRNPTLIESAQYRKHNKS